jgi:DNA polymerase-3 subunit delta'
MTLDWTDIRGQERAKTLLENALELNRLHHAYLFKGLSGVGKRSTALSLAAAINCQQRPEGSFEAPCGSCRSCKKIDDDQHPDVQTIEPDGSYIKIEQIRSLQTEATKQPHEARRRVVILDDAHALTTEAANALLKTLEEPITRMQLILVTDQAHRLLDTIISRCQTLRFSPLEREDIRAILEDRLDETEAFESRPDEETLGLAAGYGEGSAGRAWQILESGLLDERRSLIRSVADQEAGRPSRLLDLAEELGRSNDQLEAQLDVLKLFFRDVMLTMATGDRDRLVNADLTELIDDVSDRMSLSGAADRVEAIFDAEERLERNVNPQLVMENLLPRLRLEEH